MLQSDVADAPMYKILFSCIILICYEYFLLFLNFTWLWVFCTCICSSGWGHSPLLSGTRWVKSLCWNPSSASLRNCWYWWSGSGHLTPRWGEYFLRRFLIKEGFRLWKLYSFFWSVVGFFGLTILFVTNSVLNIFFCFTGVVDLYMLGCFGIFVNSAMCQFSVF